MYGPVVERERGRRWEKEREGGGEKRENCKRRLISKQADLRDLKLLAKRRISRMRERTRRKRELVLLRKELIRGKNGPSETRLAVSGLGCVVAQGLL